MSERRSVRAPAALSGGVTALAVFWVLMVLRPLPPAVGEAVALGVQSATVLVACTLMAVRARQARGRLRRARVLLTASLVFATLGGVLALVLPPIAAGAVPAPSLADLAHFAYLPLCVAGVLSYPTLPEEEGSRTRALLDGLVAAAALWFVIWVVLLGPAGVGAQLPPLTALTILSYPAADVFVIAMAAGALQRVCAQARRELALTSLGVSLYAVSDIAYTVLASQGRYVRDSWVSALAETGLVLVVLGVAQGRPGSVRTPAWARLVAGLPYLPVGVALGLAGWLSLHGTGLRAGELGLLVGVLTALLLRQLTGNRDRTALHRRLRERTALFRSLVTGSSDLITLHDLDGTVRYASPAVSRLTGLTGEQLRSVPLGALVHPDDRPALREAALELSRHPGGETELLLRVRSTTDGWRWCQALAHDLRADPDVRGIVCNTRDVHERHLLEQQVRHDACHDPLTGLGNLARARALLEAACAAAPDSATTVALVDLDGFKQVNDTFGHGQGDALLSAVAERLLASVAGGGTVTRIGGDEFLLVLADGTDGSAVAERVLQALREPLPVQGRPLTVGASVGLASTTDQPTPDELLRNADLAMYAAKAAGRNRCAWYTPDLHVAATQRMEIGRGLVQALEEDRFALHYQPIVRIADGRLAGVEALLRWQPSDGPSVPPDVFIPVAEESGVMLDIDAWVLDRACRDLARWRARGWDVPVMSVNVSRKHLTPDLPGLVEATLRRHGVRPADLCLEITESAVAPDPRTARAVLVSLRALGTRIALDDFGTGQSSLSQLGALPLDSVKVDRSFLPSSSADDRALRLLESIVGVCRALSLPVTAEGVEDPAVLQQLAELGCAYAQGFSLGRPQPADQLEATLLPALPPAIPLPRSGSDAAHLERLRSPLVGG